jgi:beta-lactamase regulating signal transducer with metallopeptidase domain
MSLLLQLTVRGSAAVLLILLLEWSLGGWICSRSRRVWWCVLPLAFLVPLRLPVFPALESLPTVAGIAPPPFLSIPSNAPAASRPAPRAGSLAFALWLAGAMAYLATAGIQTARASRKWSHERLATDPALLDMLEACRAEAGVTLPVGLVVSRTVASPAVMGWLRPRILLPESAAAELSAPELRPILLHELAHVRSRDIPFTWLLTVARATHWFNPLAHLGAIAWARFREEAADEAAIRWMRDDSGAAYGEALLRSLRLRQRASTPFGSLAVVESVHHLKKRIHMINRYRNKSSRIFVTAIGTLSLAAVVCSISVRAEDGGSSEPTMAAVSAGQRFLGKVDEHQWEAIWNDTTPRLQKFEGTESSFIALMDKSRRTAYGKCLERKLVALVFKTDPEPAFKGDYAYLCFDSSFENVPTPQREFVDLKKDSDGTWKNDGWAVDDRDRMPLAKFLPK